MKLPFGRGLCAGLLVALLLGFVVPAGAAEEVKPTGGTPAAEPDPFVVPDGGAEELAAYILKLQAARPGTMTREAIEQFAKKQATAFVTAGERLLAAKPNEQQFEAALSAKVGGLVTLEELGDSQAKKRMQQFLDELTKSGRGAIAREVTSFLLERRLSQGGDDAKVLVQVCGEINAFLKASPLDGISVRLAYMASRVVEQASDNQVLDGKQVAEIYQQFGDQLAKHAKPEFSELGRKMQGVARRFTLVGKPLELEGETADGSPLKWADYRGRVTMVVFWAISCPPCRQEIQSLREYYQKYHDRGFDVVGINLDEDRQELTSFLKENPVPWTVLFDQAGAEKKSGEMMQVRYGIFSYPRTILVDRQGKVVALDARGPKVGELLAELIGPAEAKK